MDKFLSVISDIRVVIAIAVIVLLLTIWLISQKVRTKKFKNNLERLEKRYNEVKNVPVSLKMNKARAISRVDQATADKINEVNNTFDSIQSSLSQISADLANAEDDILVGKLSRADKLMTSIGTALNQASTQVSELDRSLDALLEQDTQQRTEATALKNRFRAIKAQANEDAQKLAFSWAVIEQKISDTERMFSTFEEWMYSSDFEKANKELEQIKGNMDQLEGMIDTLPAMLNDARGVIPSLANTLHKDYKDQMTRGVYLKHLEIEDNLRTLTASLKDDLRSLKVGNITGVREHLDDYMTRLKQMDEAVLKEGEAHDSIETLSQETETLIGNANETLEYVKNQYASTAERYGFGGLDESIQEAESALNTVNTKKPLVFEDVRSTLLPATTILSSLRELNHSAANCDESLKKIREQIDAASVDEARAKKQLVKMQIIMNQLQVKIRKYKLPNISETYHEDMSKANEYIHKLEGLIDENPLNMQLLQSTMTEALDFIYKLYNNVNNVVGTVVMVENTIVFGNRYRSTYPDIDSELTRSELSFRNGEYTQALQTAIATIEKIHPGNYEAMIKENARSAA
ncbi:MAG: selenide, water dikinase [Solobacterium sp.]|nr:selenide, water dikinase [Solobacterium sp.]